jgi:hypothetical protein
MRLSSSAGSLPTAEKGARFPLSASLPKLSQDIDYNQISDADAAIFEAKMQFSAVDSGMRDVSPRSNRNAGAPIAASLPLHRL